MNVSFYTLILMLLFLLSIFQCRIGLNNLFVHSYFFMSIKKGSMGGKGSTGCYILLQEASELYKSVCVCVCLLSSFLYNMLVCCWQIPQYFTFSWESLCKALDSITTRIIIWMGLQREGLKTRWPTLALRE